MLFYSGRESVDRFIFIHKIIIPFECHQLGSECILPVPNNMLCTISHVSTLRETCIRQINSNELPFSNEYRNNQGITTDQSYWGFDRKQ